MKILQRFLARSQFIIATHNKARLPWKTRSTRVTMQELKVNNGIKKNLISPSRE
jgi:chromosome segregation ATPase